MCPFLFNVVLRVNIKSREIFDEDFGVGFSTGDERRFVIQDIARKEIFGIDSEEL